MDGTKYFVFINCIAAILVWLCCNLLFFKSYIAMFAIWLPIFLLDVLHNKRLGHFWPKTNILAYVLCYLGALVLGVILSPHEDDGIGVAVHIFWTYPIIMLGYLQHKCDINKGLLYGLELTIISGFFCGLFEYFCWGVDRPPGLMYNCILWASFMSFMLPIFIYGTKQATKKWQKWLRLTVCILIIANLLLTRSRGVILAVFIVGALVTVIYGIKYFRKYTLIGLCLVAGVVCLIYSNNFISFQRSYDGDRLAAWYASILMFKDNPFLGVGFMQWKNNFATIYFQPNVTELLPHAHNMYLGAAASTGFIGLLGLFAFLFGWGKIAWFRFQAGNCYYAYTLVGIAIFIVHGLFDYVLKAGFYEKVIWMVVFIYQLNIFKEDIDN